MRSKKHALIFEYSLFKGTFWTLSWDWQKQKLSLSSYIWCGHKKVSSRPLSKTLRKRKGRNFLFGMKTPTERTNESQQLTQKQKRNGLSKAKAVSFFSSSVGRSVGRTVGLAGFQRAFELFLRFAALRERKKSQTSFFLGPFQRCC